MPASDMLRLATVVDLDSRVSTSGFEPLGLDEKRGRLSLRWDGDRRGDNDGLLQRFTGSCGTTSLQMLLCEEDPVRAFAAHDAGLQSLAPRTISPASRRRCAAMPKRVDFNLARLRNGLGRLTGSGRISRGEAAALQAYADGKAPLDPPARRALESLRRLADGFPSDADIAEIRATRVREDQGLTTEELKAALDQYAAPVTGRTYTAIGEGDGLGRGEAREHLDRAAARRWLVSDPWSGRTAWIDEASLVSGRFIAEPFELASAGETGWIDALLVPEEKA